MATTDITNGAERSEDELREENEQLRSTVERFEQRLERLETVISSNGDGPSAGERASDETTPAVDDERVDRRGALRKLGQAAAAGAGLFVAGSALSPKAAEAADNDPITIGQSNFGGDSGSGTRLYDDSSATNLEFAATFGADNDSSVTGEYSVGLYGFSSAQSGFLSRGVHGGSNHGVGVSGASDTHYGVTGSTASTSRSGVRGSAPNGGTGIRGYIEGGTGASNGSGVRGDGYYGVEGQGNRRGVYGRSSGDGTGSWYGVYGLSSGSSGNHYGVNGSGSDAGVRGYGIGNGTGVAGYSESNGMGVFGESPTYAVYGNSTDANNGTGVFGFGAYGIWGHGQNDGAGVYGRGDGKAGVIGEGGDYSLWAQRTNNLAHVWLQPPTSGTGAPTSGTHETGELYVDSNGEIWYCATGGTPGTWTKVYTSGNASFTTFPAGWPAEGMSTKGDNNQPAENTGDKLDSGRDGNYTVDISSLIPANTTGVLMTLTAQDPDAKGYLGVWPEGAWPGNTNLNYNANENIATLAAVGVASDGSFQLRTRPGRPTHVIVSLIAAIVTQ